VNVVFSVDIFNEGVDVPSVDTLTGMQVSISASHPMNSEPILELLPKISDSLALTNYGLSV
jgi:hypothetical protein